MKTILVTGGTGFLGSFLLRELVKKEGIWLRALRRENSSMHLVQGIEDKVDWHVADLMDSDGLYAALEGVDEIYHCAAVISYHPALRKHMHLINADGTGNLVDQALARNVKRVLHISSIAALGKVVGENRVSEKVKWTESKYTSGYGLSKHKAELEMWRGMAEGLSVNMINPSVIIGPGDWDSGPPRFFKRVYNGQYFCPIGGTGFVDVRDVAELAIKLMESDHEEQRVIANGVNWSFKRFFAELASALGVSAPRFKATPFLAEIAWRVEGVKSRILGSQPLLTKETARAAMNTFEYDNSKSKTLFDFEYRDMSETVKWTAERFLAQR